MFREETHKVEIWKEELPEGGELTVRSGKEADYVFLQNFGPEAVQIKLPKGEVLFGNGDGKMAHLESIVLKTAKG